jgi:hypothetical protein
MSAQAFPKTFRVRQRFPQTAALDIHATVQRELEAIAPGLKAGARIALAVGSRGIGNLQQIVMAAVTFLKDHGARPFIVPAMGSHGGATAEGQTELLGEYGITASNLGAPVRAAMETEPLGLTADGFQVFFSREALRADGVLIVNRVKPHTDFSGTIGSGILKMMVVGLGKRPGASHFHRASSRLGYEHVLRTSARVILEKAPILGGLAIVENQHHDTAQVAFLDPARIERREEELFAEAARLMPKLPFTDVDLLIVDRLGKNISGAGMDPNVIGRGVHGYSSLLKDRNQDSPAVRRLFVRELTPESHGNATGIGLADFATTRLVRSIDVKTSTINTLTAMTPQGVKIPIHFDTDREVVEAALDTLALKDVSQARIMRIQDTLNLEWLELSEAYAGETRERSDLEIITEPGELLFDSTGNLPPLTTEKRL